MTQDLSYEVNSFFVNQLRDSDSFMNAFDNLNNIQKRTINYENCSFVVQFNPARIVSASADITKPKSESDCFLCRSNRPAYQKVMYFTPELEICVNPFPILQGHLTLISSLHENQTIKSHERELFESAAKLQGYAVFYNGAQCGASAPFHRHLQAGIADTLPIFNSIEHLKNYCSIDFKEYFGTRIFKINDGVRRFIYIESDNISSAENCFISVTNSINSIYSQAEAPINAGCTYENGLYKAVIFPREKHRSKEYYSENQEERYLISPGFADMAGIIPCGRNEDFLKLSKETLQNIMNQVCIEENKFNNINI